MTSNSPVPAAQYLRMSTEHQQYSPENQAAAIERYAKLNGFEVVQTYLDAGRSGLMLKHREGLARLLKDVVGGDQQYQAVLVYDVSRWGRFQDADEAAHYEFLCKSSGVHVHYCAETFPNDGTMPSIIMKALKRVMASEYSRELSVKVFEGQRGAVQHGFRCGSAAGYGLRRMLVSRDGSPKQLLRFGDRKSLATDRVILVLGPAHEVACVRAIFRMATHERKSFRDIAKELNRRRVKYFDRPWTYQCVQEILSNPKYAGRNIWGRTTQKLGSRQRPVPEHLWTLGPLRFEGIVDQPTFDAAQEAIHDRTWFRSDEELLDRLRTLLAAEGRLTESIIDRAPSVPTASTYMHRFGSLKRTYGLIGYQPPKILPPTALRHRLRTLRNDLTMNLLELFPEDLYIKQERRSWRPQLRFCDRLPVSILVCYCDRTVLGDIRWPLKSVPSERRNVSLVCRCNLENTAFRDYYVLPSIPHPTRVRLKEHDPRLRGGKRLASLSALRDVVERMYVKRQAIA
jgi:DNA invertase Pin-like site-specific DNA recombinase